MELASDRPTERKARKSDESGRGTLHGHVESSPTNDSVEIAPGNAFLQKVLGNLLDNIQADPDWQNEQGNELISGEQDPSPSSGDNDPPYFVGYSLDNNPIG